MSSFLRFFRAVLPCFVVLSFLFLWAHPTEAQEKKGKCIYTCVDGSQVSHVVNGEALNCDTDQECSDECVTYCFGAFTDGSCKLDPFPVCNIGGGNPIPTAQVGRYGLIDPWKGASLPLVIGILIRYAVGIVGALVLLMFLWAGILWMTAGDTDRIKTARLTGLYAFGGLLAFIFAYSAISFLLGATNVLFAPAAAPAVAPITPPPLP